MELLTKRPFVYMITMTAVFLMFQSVAFAEGEPPTEQREKSGHHQYHKDFIVHLDYYYELLAQKFAPEQVEKWNEIRQQRKVLMKQWREHQKHKDDDLNEHTEKGEWKEAHKELLQKFNEAVELRDEAKIKKILPQLFEHYEKMNQMLEEKLKQE
ncbi:hypothetical protein AJ85_04515 [Alkalihalobacillus alcalophilus ATCC 27647 = CGMCC 1.3604]|uniref:Uncharacterized protein n=1 Tax=Alkalihalobacillus alcalophilus ATCC 27647 = CGMCC 1.3604 TaxID=1218173 RepID=A0A094YWI2_ALKAL|nr:hypothetical protein [Alkalihalobacillus alcalophilus]KGA97882.1 hypothetical protein BALCAV_0207560 [Alkalihalobacillus alcalophilus ATCC 27647 = CGMCC 1.3604]MED1562129.1 hypothetical protein [Alkalihalobacillus alcalophilus]THG91500.1 hypothetical protein AJ85_04515 [Alkalihalobacillus alcalophilus ATCC 27647 = CGMCC 1.3604]